MCTHDIDDTQPHAFWDRDWPPRLRIQPGDPVVFECLEGAGQITPTGAKRPPRSASQEATNDRRA
jgi:acetamidase/formamidase